MAAVTECPLRPAGYDWPAPVAQSLPALWGDVVRLVDGVASRAAALVGYGC